MPLRLFAALDIPDGAAARLLAMHEPIPGAKWRPRENLHLTLHFFDDVGEEVQETLDEALAEVALRNGPFALALTSVGAFGGADPHALIIKAADNAALERLAEACKNVARRLRLQSEARKYTPHVTLAYLNNTPVDAVMAFERRHALMKPIAFDATELTLFSSWTKKNAPNLYRPEASYSLGGID